MSVTARFCPNCKTVQATYAAQGAGGTILRCRTCGFPVEEKLPEGEATAPVQSKVLCIDDDAVVLHILVSTLEKRGYQPLTARDGTAGIETAKREQPTLILLDVRMPGMEGFEVCRRLKADAQTRAIPVIILTALGDANLNVQAFKAGADLALTKPFEPDRLLATIQAALALKSRRPFAF